MLAAAAAGGKRQFVSVGARPAEVNRPQEAPSVVFLQETSLPDPESFWIQPNPSPQPQRTERALQTDATPSPSPDASPSPSPDAEESLCENTCQYKQVCASINPPFVQMADCDVLVALRAPARTFAQDSICDDGGQGAFYANCGFGTDCADCGARVASPRVPLSPSPDASPSPSQESYLCEDTCVFFQVPPLRHSFPAIP